MGHLNNDVIRLIRSIVTKNKIHRCNKSYHERYEIVHTNNEYYYIKHQQIFHGFNYRNLSRGCVGFSIFKMGTSILTSAKLPKNY